MSLGELSMEKPRLLYIFLLFNVFFSAVTAEAARKVFFMKDNYRSIFVFDETKNATEAFYSAASPYGIRDFKVSSSGNHIGVFELVHAEESGKLPQRIVILDSSGKVVQTINNALEFAWSAKGDSLAYIRGDKFEDKTRPLQILVVQVIPTFTSSVLSDHKIYDISWAEQNRKIYGWGRDVVYEIDPTTKATRNVSCKGIFFSSSGSYVFKANYGIGFEIFSSSSNEKMTLTGIDEENANTYIWLDDKTLLIGDFTYEKSVVDVEKNLKKQTFQGQVLDYNPRTKEILYLRPENVIGTFTVSSSTIRKLRLD